MSKWWLGDSCKMKKICYNEFEQRKDCAMSDTKIQWASWFRSSNELGVQGEQGRPHL